MNDCKKTRSSIREIDNEFCKKFLLDIKKLGYDLQDLKFLTAEQNARIYDDYQRFVGISKIAEREINHRVLFENSMLKLIDKKYISDKQFTDYQNKCYELGVYDCIGTLYLRIVGRVKKQIAIPEDLWDMMKRMHE